MSKDFKQYDIRWAKHSYCKTTMKAAGCGPTAVADIFHNFKTSIIPPNPADWFTNNAYDSNKQGTIWTGIPAYFNRNGQKAKQLNANNAYGCKSTKAENEWKEAMKSGKCWGILLMGKGYWTSGGHYIAVTDYDFKTGKFYVMDPASIRRTGWHAWKDFDGEVKIFYLVYMTKKEVVTDKKLTVDGSWGQKTTKAAQKKFGTTVDGIVSHQPDVNEHLLPACDESSWQFHDNFKKSQAGSSLVKAMQKKFAIKTDGWMGERTIKALQDFLGIEEKKDGKHICGKKTVEAFQRYLNS